MLINILILFCFLGYLFRCDLLSSWTIDRLDVLSRNRSVPDTLIQMPYVPKTWRLSWMINCAQSTSESWMKLSMKWSWCLCLPSAALERKDRYRQAKRDKSPESSRNCSNKNKQWYYMDITSSCGFLLLINLQTVKNKDLRARGPSPKC